MAWEVTDYDATHERPLDCAKLILLQDSVIRHAPRTPSCARISLATDRCVHFKTCFDVTLDDPPDRPTVRSPASPRPHPASLFITPT